MLYKTTRCDDMDLFKKFSAAFETTLGKMVCHQESLAVCHVLKDTTKAVLTNLGLLQLRFPFLNVLFFGIQICICNYLCNLDFWDKF